jgi:hypothetical protein
MIKPLALFLTATAAAFAGGPSNAAVIDFSNTGCTANNSQNCLIPQTYGDTVDVDVSYRTLSATTGQPTGSGLFQFGSYGDLTDVVYGGGDGLHYIAEITLTATMGHLLSLQSFDVATYNRRASYVPISIYDLAGNLLSGGTYVTGSPTHATVKPSTGYLSGVVIRWGPDSYNVGLDNITYDAQPVIPVPEPATWAMLLCGFGAMGWSLRRRDRDRLLSREAV